MKINFKNLMKKAVCLFLTVSAMMSPCSAFKSIVSAEEFNGYSSKYYNDSITSGSSLKLTDDYYAYVNKKVLDEHDPEKIGGSWNWFYDLDDKAYNEQKSIIQSSAANVSTMKENSSEYKIGMLYSLAADWKGRDEDGVKYFNELIKPAMEAKNIQEFMNAMAELQYHYGFDTLFNTEVLALDEDSDKYIVQLKGLNFGVDVSEFEDINSDEGAEEEVIIYFNDYLAKLLTLAWQDENKARMSVNEIYKFLKEIANSRKDEDISEKSLIELQKLMTNIDLKQYLGKIYKIMPENIITLETSSLPTLNKYLTEENLTLLKDYIYLINLEKFALYMTSDMTKANKDMKEDFPGDTTVEKDDKTMVKQVASLLDWDLGKLYTEKNFSDKKKKGAENIINELLTEYRLMIQEEKWLSKETKENALKKLDKIKVRIGVPANISDYLSSYSPVSRSDGGSYLSNVMAIRKENSEWQYDCFGKKVDKDIWNLLPQEMNPCYYPTDNSINIPVAALEAPYFSENASEEENLGAIGTIIGHEITHAFDDLGSQYDGDGKYINWWTDKDRKEFEKRAERVVKYYDEYKTPGEMKQDGKQTLGENLADLGSMNCLSRIVSRKKLSAEKFFQNYANSWASTSDGFTQAIMSGMDEHASDKVRVNAVLSSCGLFYKTYNLKNNDAMYIKPSDRVEFWTDKFSQNTDVKDNTDKLKKPSKQGGGGVF